MGLLMGLPGGAMAVDGVVEINEARVQAGNITPGDTPGYPVTITRPGSYRLTGDLSHALVPGESAIDVLTNGATIDLNGFTIFGPGCSAAAISQGQCTGAAISGGGQMTVLNGQIQASAGIRLSEFARVSNVTLTAYAAGVAIQVTGDGNVIENVQIDMRGAGIGIQANHWNDGRPGSILVRDAVIAFRSPGSGTGYSESGFVRSRLERVVVRGGQVGISSHGRLLLSDSMIEGQTSWGVVNHNNTGALVVALSGNVIDAAPQGRDIFGPHVHLTPSSCGAGVCP